MLERKSVPLARLDEMETALCDSLRAADEHAVVLNALPRRYGGTSSSGCPRCIDIVSSQMISIDNRRLWCLQEFQRRVPSGTVYAKTRVKVWNLLFDRFLKHLDSEQGSAAIRDRH